jgi:tetratricopeptide (TPR) repeat protein
VKRAARVTTAAGLGLALFGLGGLGLFNTEPDPSGPPLSTRTLESLLGAGGGGRTLDRTIAALQARVRGNGDDWRSLADLGVAYLQKARLTADPSWYTKAEGALSGSLTVSSRVNPRATLGMGVLNLARHDFSEALEWGRRASALDPYDASARGVIGDALAELGRYDDAVRAFQKMVDLRPDLGSYARVSYARELHGDVSGAIQAMNQALEAAGGDPEDAAWVAYQLGDLYLGSGRIGRAEKEYRRGAHLAVDHVLPRAGLAKVAASRGRLDEAARILTGVVDRHPAPEFVILLGDLHAAAGRHDDADEQYQLVRAMQRLYRANGVNADLEMALFDADHGIHLERALERARAEYRRRPSIYAADALAWTLSAVGRHREAAGYARAALRLGTRNALFHFHAGMIAFRLRQPADAEDHLSTALEIHPDFSFLHRDVAARTLHRLQGGER